MKLAVPFFVGTHAVLAVELLLVASGWFPQRAHDYAAVGMLLTVLCMLMQGRLLRIARRGA